MTGPTRHSLGAALALTLSVAVIGNGAVRGVLFASTEVPDSFIPMRLGAIVIVTIVAVLAATLAMLACRRWARHPRRVFVALLLAGFVLSMIPIAGMAEGDENDEFSSPNAATTAAVVVVHLIPLVSALAFLAPQARGERRELPQDPDSRVVDVP